MNALTRTIITPVLVGLTAFVGGSACDALQSTTMAVGVLTKTPELSEANVGSAARLLDQLSDFEAPVQEAVAAAAFVGNRPSATDTTAIPTGIGGATVRLSWAGKTVTLAEVRDQQATGSYAAYSIDFTGDAVTDDDIFVDESLQYIEDGEYTMYVDVLGDYYDLTIEAPPAIPATAVSFSPALVDETVPAVTPAMTLKTHSKNTALTVAWTTPEPQQAFVTLARVNFNGTYPNDLLNENQWSLPTQNPLVDNFPRTAEAFLQLVTAAPVTEFEFEAANFNQAGIYVLLVTAVNLNTSTTGLALGSGGIGGVATPFAFLVKP